MSRAHLSEQELIDYRIELIEGDERAAIAAHLAECEACRERLAALAQRLSMLDLLREDEAVPAALLAETMALGATVPRSSRRPWLIAGWLAAAAMLVAALIVFWPDPRPPVPVQALLPPVPTDLTMLPLPAAGSRPTVPADAEQAPFAPASNIELNVLPRRDSVQLTIYNSADLTLVRERRQLTMKKGWNWLQFMWANTLIDPTSLELTPAPGSEILVQQLVFPARLKDIGRWLMYSPVSGAVPFEVTYFTSGLSWRAFYFATLSEDESKLHLAGYVRVANRSGEEYADAQVRLVVGEVNLREQIAMLAQRQYPYGRPGMEGGEGWSYADDVSIVNEVGELDAPRDRASKRLREEVKQVLKEGLSEYFLYTIEGEETIPDGWDKRLPSFAADAIPVVNLYKHDPERWGDQVVRFLYFANDEAHRLGETPLPEGVVKVYRQVDRPAAGHLAYEGTAPLKYIPVGEEIELDLGAVEQVQVEPVLMSRKTENYAFDQHQNIAGWDEVSEWELRLGNRRPLPVKLEITRPTGSPAWQLDANDGNAVKHDATHLRWTLDLPANTERTLRYTLRVLHGQNADQ